MLSGWLIANWLHGVRMLRTILLHIYAKNIRWIGSKQGERWVYLPKNILFLLETLFTQGLGNQFLGLTEGITQSVVG